MTNSWFRALFSQLQHSYYHTSWIRAPFSPKWAPTIFVSLFRSHFAFRPCPNAMRLFCQISPAFFTHFLLHHFSWERKKRLSIVKHKEMLNVKWVSFKMTCTVLTFLNRTFAVWPKQSVSLHSNSMNGLQNHYLICRNRCRRRNLQVRGNAILIRAFLSIGIFFNITLKKLYHLSLFLTTLIIGSCILFFSCQKFLSLVAKANFSNTSSTGMSQNWEIEHDFI